MKKKPLTDANESQADILARMEADGRIKGVRCYCGAGYLMLCRMPMAEEERDIVKDFAKYARLGHRIDMLDAADKPSFCECKNPLKVKKKTKDKKAPVHFVDPKQLFLNLAGCPGLSWNGQPLPPQQ